MAALPTFSNPEGVHAPAGLYSHGVLVPANTDLLFLSGQVGIRPDGSTGEGMFEQADQVFRNIGTILEANGMTFSNIVKLTTYMTVVDDGPEVRRARIKHLGDHRPASTAIYVLQLVSPEWLVEIDAVAARS